MNLVLRFAALFFVVAGSIVAAIGVHAGKYPDKPIRFIVAFPPGGSSDILARAIGQKLAEKVQQSVVVDNRPGGGSIIGTGIAAKAAPDGYTILLVASSFVINPSIHSKLPYDVIGDFVPISLVARVPLVLLINPSTPAKSVGQLIALAKSRPGQLNFGSGGVGTSPHLAGELFKSLAGISIVHVPYRGANLALADLLGGRVQLVFANMPVAMSQIKSANLRPLAVTDSKRLTALPRVPTLAEAGVPEYEAVAWYGVVGPAGIPRGIITRLNMEFVKILDMPDIKERLASDGAEPFSSTLDEFATLIKTEIVKWADVVKKSGAAID